jgi:hypothetical protein
VNDVTLIFGGMVDQVYLADLWALDSTGQWSELKGGGGPVEPVEVNGISGYPLMSLLVGITLIAQIGWKESK